MTRPFFTQVCMECGDRVVIGISLTELMTVCAKCRDALDRQIEKALEDLSTPLHGGNLDIEGKQR